jgi:hypothetical protein
MHAEVESLYLSNNLFHLPRNLSELRPFTLRSTEYGPLPRRTILFSETGVSRIRDITFEIGHRLTRQSVNGSYSAVEDKLCHFVRGLDYAQIDYTHPFCPGGCYRKFRWTFKLAPKNLVASEIREGDEADVRSAYDGFRNDVEVLENKLNLRFLSPGEKTVWDAYELSG